MSYNPQLGQLLNRAATSQVVGLFLGGAAGAAAPPA